MLKATLDKTTGLRVKCGRKHCDGDFGQVTTIGKGARLLRLNPGWQRDPHGVLEQSRHSGRRIEQQGLQPRNRCEYHGARPLVSQGRDPAFSYGVVDQPLQLPIVARCRKCGWRNELTAEALDVTAFDLTAPDN